MKTENDHDIRFRFIEYFAALKESRQANPSGAFLGIWAQLLPE